MLGSWREGRGHKRGERGSAPTRGSGEKPKGISPLGAHHSEVITPGMSNPLFPKP